MSYEVIICVKYMKYESYWDLSQLTIFSPFIDDSFARPEGVFKLIQDHNKSLINTERFHKDWVRSKTSSSGTWLS